MQRIFMVVGLAAAALLMVGSATRAMADIYVGREVDAASRTSINRIDHTAWNGLLAKYCDQRGYVNYPAWQRSPADRKALSSYLAQLSQGDPKLQASREARLAFWINAYNAVTIEGILRVYPTTSIRNHTAKLFGYNIWDDLLLRVGDRTYSLNQMEHEVLRKMGEPRVHFAIVCASIGCPPLWNQAYTAQQIDEQLTANAKRFFANPSKFRYDSARGTVGLSPILKWFAEDFGSNQAAQLRTIGPYLPNPIRGGQPSVSYLNYDWDLNDQATQK